MKIIHLEVSTATGTV